MVFLDSFDGMFKSTFHTKKVVVKHISPHYAEYRKKIENLKIIKPEIVDEEESTIENPKRHSFFSEDLGARQQHIADFLSGKHDGLVADIVQSERPHFQKYFQVTEKTQHK